MALGRIVDQRRKLPAARQIVKSPGKHEKGELADHPEVVYHILPPYICKELIVDNGRERDFAVDKREAVVLNNNPFSNEELKDWAKTKKSPIRMPALTSMPAIVLSR
jgi:hypothetical protein